jgi:hypothetical protein
MPQTYACGNCCSSALKPMPRSEPGFGGPPGLAFEPVVDLLHHPPAVFTVGARHAESDDPAEPPTPGPLARTDITPTAASRTGAGLTRRWRLGMDRFVDGVAG